MESSEIYTAVIQTIRSFLFRCSVDKIPLAIAAMCKLAWENPNLTDIQRRQVQSIMVNGVDKEYNSVSVLIGNIGVGKEYTDEYTKADEVIDCVVNNLEVSDIQKVNLRMSEEAQELLEKYHKVVRSKNPALTLFATMISSDEESLWDDTSRSILEGFEDSDVTRNEAWYLIGILADIHNEIVEDVDKYKEAYEFHRGLRFKYCFLEHYHMRYKEIEKTITYMNMFKDTTKIEELTETDESIGAARYYFRQPLDYMNTFNTNRTFRGFKAIYDLEAHKLSDEAVRRYRVLI